MVAPARTRRRLPGLLVLAGLLVVALGAPGAAQMGGGGSLSVEVKPRAGPPRATAGSPVRLVGTFDPDGRPVELRWGDENGMVLARVAPDSRGDFRRTVYIPAGTPGGTYLITATQEQIDGTMLDPAKVSIDVVADEAQATVATGAEGDEPVPPRRRPAWVVPALVAADVLLLGALIALRRRRRARSTTG